MISKRECVRGSNPLTPKISGTTWLKVFIQICVHIKDFWYEWINITLKSKLIPYVIDFPEIS